MRFLALFLAGLLTAGVFLDLSGCTGNQRTDDTQGILVTFQHEMLEAINAEKRYPFGALDARKGGSVTVGFDYTAGGKADNMEIVKSSGDADLDHSAIMAVYFAKLPAEPPELAGVTHFVVTINFISR